MLTNPPLFGDSDDVELPVDGNTRRPRLPERDSSITTISIFASPLSSKGSPFRKAASLLDETAHTTA
jgi:hypothetical protein